MSPADDTDETGDVGPDELAPTDGGEPSTAVGSDAPEGGGVLRATVAGTVAFVAVGVLALLLPDLFTGPFIAVALGELLVGSIVFILAFLRAVDRSRTEAIGVGGLFFGAGSTPGRVQRILVGSLAVQVVAAIVVASIRPYTSMAFGVLAPMWALGFTGLWAAAYGTFPERTPEPTRAAVRDAQRRAHRGTGSAGRRDRTE